MSAAPNFKKGDRVYDEHGQAGQYVARIDRGHVVQVLYQFEDDEPAGGDVQVWPVVCDKPPTVVLEARVAELDAKITERSAKLNEVNAKISAAEFESRAVMSRLEHFEPLRKLDDYLAGKITHYVLDSGYGSVSILAAEAALTRDNSYSKKRRLLSLATDEKGQHVTPQWHLNSYSDGSGSDEPAWPCTSMEEAMQTAAARVDAYFVAWREKTKQQYGYYIESASASATRLGISVPDDIAQAVRAEQAKRARAAAEKAQAEAKKAADELAALTGGAV